MISGNMNSEWAKHGMPNATTELAKNLGLSEYANEYEILECLNTSSIKDIVKAQHNIITDLVTFYRFNRRQKS